MSFRPVFLAERLLHPIEWLPVVTSALAIGFLIVPFAARVAVPYLRLCALVLLLQAVVGGVGFVFHAVSVLRQPGGTVFEKILTGAPPMAPLLFPNLVVLGWIGLWVLLRQAAGRTLTVGRRID